MLQRREGVEKEVRVLRQNISELKKRISTIMIGVPMTKIEVSKGKGRRKLSSPKKLKA